MMSDGIECGWWVATSAGLVCQSWDFRFPSGWDEKTLEGLPQMTGMTYLTFYGGYHGCSMEGRQGLYGWNPRHQSTRATHIVNVNIGRVRKGGKQL